MRITGSMLIALLLSKTASAAPAIENSLQALLDKSCQGGTCVEAYNVKFRQITYEEGRQQTTLFLNLLAHQGISYPILQERFEAQLTQSSFSAVCKVKDVTRETFDALSRNESTDGTEVFRRDLKSCLSVLASRTEQALGN